MMQPVSAPMYIQNNGNINGGVVIPPISSSSAAVAASVPLQSHPNPTVGQRGMQLGI